MRIALYASALSVLIAAVSLPGCVPDPVYKTLQPAAKVTVRGQGNLPLANAQATLIARASPTPFEQRRETKMTLPDGTARFDAVRELRVEMTALHGWEEFYWNWCIRKEGYVTYQTHQGGAGKFEKELTVQLEPGQSRPCPPARVLNN